MTNRQQWGRREVSEFQRAAAAGACRVRSSGKRIVAMVAVLAALGACSGKKRDFVSDREAITDTTTETQPNNPSADPEITGTPLPGDPTAAPEDGQLAEVPLDTPAIAGTGLCDADAGCTCNAEAQSCDPLPLCDGGIDCAAGCAGCVVDSECVAAGAPNPNNPCQACDPTQNPTDWSAADGASCDDGAFCTVDDVCQAAECVGTPRACDDGVACNGASTCDEIAQLCTPGQSQCGANAVCNIATGACTSTCPGCVISGTCHAAGGEEPGNPCRVCDPARSTSAFSPAAGKACGAPAGVCSAQDTCDAQGQCQPNHSPEGTACGNAAVSPCDGPDTCDGRGSCQPRIAANAASCSDGRFCTVGDACQGGVCSPTGNRNCGDGLACNENADQCQCQGCVVGGNCFAAGALNGNNPCQICDPARSTTSFSGNTGSRCGSGATECSAQDTCNVQGQCVPNDLAFPTPCQSVPGGQCQGDGRCVAPQPARARLTIVTNGTGTVTSPSGINCGSSCSVLLNVGTQVNLQAVTTNGSNAFFSGWSATDCSGPARSCTVTVTADRTVTATFSPMTNNLIFVSSATFPSNLGGVAAYDAQCNRIASAAGINNSGGNAYVAFMADSTATLRDRIDQNVRGWVRVDGKPFATTLNALFDNKAVLNPPIYDELGGRSLQILEVFTGMAADGRVTRTCANWTAGATGNAQTGTPIGGPGVWAAVAEEPCNGNPQRIYCAGIERTAPLIPVAATGKRIWVTPPALVPGSGSAPDGLCFSSRPAGVGAAVALLARVARPAGEVLDPAARYVRPDGQVVGTGQQLLDFANAQTAIESGIWQSGDGVYIVLEEGGRVPVTTGGGRLNEIGAVETTCNDWTDPAGRWANGILSFVNGQWWQNRSDNLCVPDDPLGFRIYCVQP